MKEILSSNNKYIKELYKIKKSNNSKENDCFLIEGKNIIERAKDKKIIEKLLVTKNNIDFSCNIEQILVNQKIIDKLSLNNSNPGIIGIVKTKNYIHTNFNIDKYKKIIILENVNNPNNLGSIARTALAFNYECIITLENSVNFLNDKVIKSSQGAIFDIPIYNLKTFDQNLFKKFKVLVFQKNILSQSISKYDSSKLNNKNIALLFGNEANGVSENIQNLYKQNLIHININEKIESLNLAIASSIAMFLLK